MTAVRCCVPLFAGPPQEAPQISLARGEKRTVTSIVELNLFPGDRQSILKVVGRMIGWPRERSAIQREPSLHHLEMLQLLNRESTRLPKSTLIDVLPFLSIARRADPPVRKVTLNARRTAAAKPLFLTSLGARLLTPRSCDEPPANVQMPFAHVPWPAWIVHGRTCVRPWRVVQRRCHVRGRPGCAFRKLSRYKYLAYPYCRPMPCKSAIGLFLTGIVVSKCFYRAR